MTALVECRSDSTYAERPIAFTWQGRRLEIQAVLHSWRTPSGKHFRVCTNDHQVYDLVYDESADEWHIHQP